jgi:hypothetical protein
MGALMAVGAQGNDEMPWTPQDADKHVKGLTPGQKDVWANVANRVLKDCEGDGCEAKAIKMANAQAQRVGKVAKLDTTKHLVFGWAYVSKTRDGEQVIDHSGEFMDPEVLEDAVYKYVLESRDANDMHDGPVTGKLIESFVVTPDKLEAMGLEKNALPLGAWVGFKLEPEAF